MSTNTHPGFRRLAIFCAVVAASAWTVFFLHDAFFYSYDVPKWLAFAFIAGTAPVVAGLVWVFVRGLAWVHAGFQRSQGRFPQVNWN
jgi:hypothetical protein